MSPIRCRCYFCGSAFERPVDLDLAIPAISCGADACAIAAREREERLAEYRAKRDRRLARRTLGRAALAMERARAKPSAETLRPSCLN